LFDIVIFIAILLFAFFEIELISVNYLCRIKYPQYFREGEKTKAKLDRNGHKIFSVFILPIILKISLLTIFIGIYYYINQVAGLSLIWFLVGIVFTNDQIDKMTFEDRMICVKSGCPKIIQPSPCEICDVHEKYKFRLKLFQDPVITKVEKK